MSGDLPGLSDAELLKIRTEVQATSARDTLGRARDCLAGPWSHDDWPARVGGLAYFTKTLADELERALAREQEWIQAAAAGQAVTAAAPTGQATLSAADLLTVLGALRDGARWNEQGHGDPATAARYRSLARSLGDDR